MRVSEYLLLVLSKKPGRLNYKEEEKEWTINNALSLLSTVFPNFIKMIVNKRILDFGCGLGYQSAALGKAGSSFVHGVDTNSNLIKKANALINTFNLQKKIQFSEKITGEMRGQFDIVISQNSMEHFPDPIATIDEMKIALKQKGKILITFGPPWYAPYGVHMFFFNRVPWMNILFSEKTVMKVRSHYRNDGATKYQEVEKGLNKMTILKFERIISDTGLRIAFKRYDCVKGLNFLGKLPYLRELFINQVSVILTRRL